MGENANVFGVGLDTATQFTQLLATHGVYALVILYMFFQQRQARINLRECKESERGHYQKQNSLILWTTIMLSVVATGAWVYATFVYQPRVTIEGTIKDLAEQPKRPQRFGDPPMVLHRVTAFRSDVNFYSFEKPSLRSGSVDLGWAIVASSGRKLVQLVFQQQYCMMDSQNSNETLTAISGQEGLTPKEIEGSPVKRATLDLNLHKSLLGQQIQVVYKSDPADPIRNIGKLFAVDGEDRLIPIPWVEETAMESSPAVRSTPQAALFGAGVAWAETPHPQLIGQKGEIDPEIAQRVKQYLESDDLDKQLAAQAVLVENRERSFPLIGKILAEKSGEGRNRGLLVHNLAAVVGKIEKSGARAPSDVNLLLGESLSAIGDYTLAIAFFSRVPESQPLPASTLLLRSLAFLETNRFADAERGFQEFHDVVNTPGEKSMALSNIGTVYSRKGDAKQAKEYFNRAISLNPKNVRAQYNLGLVERQLGDWEASANAFRRASDLNPKDPTARIQMALDRQLQGRLKEAASILEEVIQSNPRDSRGLNNLAYVYALQGEKLGDALEYSERAIKLGGETSHSLDTKGWVLHRMGKSDQGLEYLKRALAKEPTDLVIQDHVKEAQRMAAATAKKG